MKFTCDGNVVSINDKECKFSYDIRQATLIDELVIVLLDIPMGKLEINNLYAVSKEGNIAWQIQDTRDIYQFESYLPYEYFRINDAQEIVVWNFYGVAYVVNPINGKIIGRDSTK